MEYAVDDEREIRAARNQSLFRAVNEKIREVNEAFAEISGTFAIACECFDTRCVQTLQISDDAYRQIRAHPHRFAVLRGHVLPEVEEIVEERSGYVVVEKVRVAAEVAEALDPRRA